MPNNTTTIPPRSDPARIIPPGAAGRHLGFTSDEIREVASVGAPYTTNCDHPPKDRYQRVGLRTGASIQNANEAVRKYFYGSATGIAAEFVTIRISCIKCRQNLGKHEPGVTPGTINHYPP